MKTKIEKIVLESYGSFLGMEKGCFVVRDKNKNEKKYPLFESEIGEVQIRSGNLVSSGALTSLAFWQIDTLLLTGRGRPVAVVKSLEDDSHISTRLCQYESHQNGMFSEIAKQFILSKFEGQNQVLSKYGLRRLDYLHFEKAKGIEEPEHRILRNKLTAIESHCSRHYFNEIFQLFDALSKPEGRKGFRAYDGINNLFNLGYEILSWKIHIALIRARLEPFLGYLHSVQYGKPSLVCDFEELYRYLIDDYIIAFASTLKPKDFILKSENLGERKGKRQYLNDVKTKIFMKGLEKRFLETTSVPRCNVGTKQEIESLINEEAMLFAKFLRGERPTWVPRIAEIK